MRSHALATSGGFRLRRLAFVTLLAVVLPIAPPALAESERVAFLSFSVSFGVFGGSSLPPRLARAYEDIVMEFTCSEGTALVATLHAPPSEPLARPPIPPGVATCVDGVGQDLSPAPFRMEAGVWQLHTYGGGALENEGRLVFRGVPVS